MSECSQTLVGRSPRRPRWRGWGRTAAAPLAALLLLMGAAGCRPAPEEEASAYLVRVGAHTLTAAEFESAWTAWRAATGGEGETDPGARRADRTRLLQQLTEEMVLLERARELGLTVSDAEVGAAVAAIRKDYPGEAFEEMLVENAVALPQWEAGLRRRLIVDKLIEADVAARIQIDEEEIAARYRTYLDEQAAVGAPAETSPDLHDQLVRQLRREKTEAAYGDWVRELRQRTVVKVNEALLAQVLEAQP